MAEITEVYTDGGVCRVNPSPHGGTWCFVRVDADGFMADVTGGIVLPEALGVPAVTNNQTELLAAVLALESLPAGWGGTLCTDSQVTVYRLTREKPRFRGIPASLERRCRDARQRAGPGFRAVLVVGHPTRCQVANGQNRFGRPASRWNVLCDETCSRLAREHMARLEATT